MASEFLKDKSVLITGGTGSFGQKFVKTLLAETRTRKIIIFSRDELKQSQMAVEIPDPEERLRFFIGDVRDQERLGCAFNGVDYIIHAAALKQVPTLEYNPFEAVKTNILGTQNVINAALDKKVKKVLLISTDKAANPANLYGATKLCAERLMVSGNAYSGLGGTKFSVIRYGNVFGSRGSLIKIIKEQRASGEITLTHGEMTRFLITLEQGIKMVLGVVERMRGGEIFVPKIPSMRIKDLVVALAPECKIKVIGIRPGEKLHEVLITKEEAHHTKEYDDNYVILPEYDWWTEFEHYKDGKGLDGDFYLTSDGNKQWLSGEDIRGLMDSL